MRNQTKDVGTVQILVPEDIVADLKEEKHKRDMRGNKVSYATLIREKYTFFDKSLKSS